MVRLQFSLLRLLIYISIFGCIFAFVGYRNHQYRILVSRSSEFYRLRNTGDIETSYKFMTPDYRQDYSLPEFISNSGFPRLDSAEPFVTISLMAGNATIYEHEARSFEKYSGCVHRWRQVDGQWYYTGESDYLLDY